MMDAPTLKRWQRIGCLSALSLVLAYLETFIPIPIPGVKLGLANIAVMAALAERDVAGAASIAAIKVLVVGFLFASPITLAYSVVGTVLSFIVAAPLSQLKTMRLWMASIAGSVAHELGQLMVAALLISTNAIFLITFPLLVVSVLTGALSGVLATRLARTLSQSDLEMRPQGGWVRPVPKRPPTAARVAFFLYLAGAIICFHTRGPLVPATLTLLALMTCIAVHAKRSRMISGLRLVLFMGCMNAVLNLLATGSLQLADVGVSSLRLAYLSLGGTVIASLMATSDVGETVSWMLLPLERLGVNTDGFVCALSVAVRAVPAISQIVGRRMAGRNAQLRLSDLPHELDAIVFELMDQI